MDKVISAEFQKRASALLDYTIDWTTWLNGDTIASSAWEIPDGITAEYDTNSGTSTIVWLSGGTAWQIYELKNSIVTQGGREDYRMIAIKVIE